MNEKTQAPSWKDELNRRIVDYLVSNGSPVDPKPSYYGWLADDYRELHAHLSGCALDYAKCDYEDTEWTEFAGTFAELSDSYMKGIKALVTCSCGQVAAREWRVRDGSYAEMLKAITADE